MNMRQKFLVLCLTLFACAASYSWGFERQAHLEMSKTAVRLYHELYPSNSRDTDELTSLFIAASGREDDITLSLQRLFNWHFYDPGSRLGRAWWGARKANTKRFASLAEKLFDSRGGDPRKTYEYAGRLAHHIQDMSSPPHTVPIYHTTIDPFDTFATEAIAGIRPATVQLDAVRAGRRDLTLDALQSMLKTAAERTTARVGKPVRYNGKEIVSDWTGFWRRYELTGPECEQEPKTGFGCYGMNTFGEPAGNFTPEVYLDFYKTQVASAIADSLRLLLLLHDMK